ncbi:MFS transporter [Rhodococcoides kroppenstedtii]|uniref:MFS transporter n=1 Tax=Rhodococcoides kroppenstedtii TaxID=293050 RepID=UPI0028E7A7D5|nr:MFS transporter [Rhodococcus kroppenstedtii]
MSVVLYAASREFVPLYAVYALLFRDSGLSVAQISSLFAIWTLVSFVLEVPSGALADVVPRRLLLVLAALLAAASFATWILVPSYLGFAVGFVLWGIGGALQSGTFEALIYDALARDGRTSSYAGLAGTAEAASTTSTLVALLVASPLLATGSFELVGWASVGAAMITALLARRLPDPPRGTPDGATHDEPGWLDVLRSGTAEVVASRAVARGVMLLAAVAGVLVVDEYTPLIADDLGAPTESIPLLLAIPMVGQIVGTALAGRAARASTRTIAALLVVAAAGLAVVSWVGSIGAFVALGVATGILWALSIVAEARLQDAITGRSRATVMSVAGVASEGAGLLVVGWYAVGPPPVVATALLSVATVLLIVLAREPR